MWRRELIVVNIMEKPGLLALRIAPNVRAISPILQTEDATTILLEQKLDYVYHPT